MTTYSVGKGKIPDPNQEALFQVTLPEQPHVLTPEEMRDFALAIGATATAEAQLRPPIEEHTYPAQEELGGGSRTRAARSKPAYTRRPKIEAPLPPPTHGSIQVDPENMPDVAEMRRVMLEEATKRAAGVDGRS